MAMNRARREPIDLDKLALKLKVKSKRHASAKKKSAAQDRAERYKVMVQPVGGTLYDISKLSDFGRISSSVVSAAKAPSSTSS